MTGIRILVAGVGNRLMGDDGFGPRVIDLLQSTHLQGNVELRDLGTAGLSVATDLDEFDLAVFLDSVNMDGEPGKLLQTEVSVNEDLENVSEFTRVTLHEIGLEGLLRIANALGTLPRRVILVGCKPKALGPIVGLSPEVEEAAHKAVKMVLEIVEKSNQNG